MQFHSLIICSFLPLFFTGILNGERFINSRYLDKKFLFYGTTLCEVKPLIEMYSLLLLDIFNFILFFIFIKITRCFDQGFELSISVDFSVNTGSGKIYFSSQSRVYGGCTGFLV